MAIQAGQTVTSTDSLTRTERWATSTALIVFTMAMATVCIILLSTTLTQTRLSSLAIDGVPVSIRKLDLVAQAWAKHRNEETLRAAELETAEKSRLKIMADVAAADAIHALAKDEMEGLLAGFNHTLQALEPDLAKAISGKAYEDQVGRLKGVKNQLLEKHSHLGETLDAIDKTYAAYRDGRRNQIEAKARLDWPERQIKLLRDQQKHAEGGLDKVFALIREKLDPADRARVENAFFDINVTSYVSKGSSLRSFVGGYFYSLMTIQPDLLTLFLVIFMGILGSALQITHAYFIKNEAYTVGRYFQRISVGALTALVIFIVAKAGVPVIADANRLGGEATINPYFVSFLAIISGLLSENAIANVQAQGARLFGQTGDGIDRWARTDLTDELAAQGLSIESLAAKLGLDTSVADTKLRGQAEIKPAEQKILSLYLRREPRDLFTDIPPPAPG